MTPRQISHYEQLQRLETDLRYYQESAKAMAERVEGLEAPGQVDRSDLRMARKVLARDLRM